ncbi:hypothetical protein HAP47_0022255 [Bradyrhizobium sp. 41S5]|uniref:hypothetical protein n=1 Tax=Bradyrhizobium sp. 41S5 TaxID=1404443 RepID=UPI00156A8243|nr:hypothetical protein [Bradyrhizobium sp. 41S5]UFX42017.1 hypothetical protein HAP47_0022255 [Bradyrhizobium sp. 41S5]
MPYDEDYDYGYDDAYDSERDCEHEHYEIDVCTGRAQCEYCSKSWHLSAEEIDAELDRQANYQEECEREERRRRRREFWRKLTLPVRWPIFRLLERVWPRNSLSILTDDEISF